MTSILNKVKKLFIILVVLIVAAGTSCTPLSEKLTEGSWNIIEGTHGGQQIIFISKSLIQFRMANSNGNPSFAFRDNGNIFLPGINSNDINATWDVINEHLKLTVHIIIASMEYPMKKWGIFLKE